MGKRLRRKAKIKMNLKTGKYVGKYNKYMDNNIEYKKANSKKIKEMWKKWKLENEERVKISNKIANSNKEYKQEWIKNNKESYLISKRKNNSKRRKLEFVTLNKYFDGAVAHHINNNEVIFIPYKVHKSVYHNIHTRKNMDVINEIAIKYLEESK